VVERILASQRRDDGDGADIGQRNPQVDDLAHDQVHRTDQQSQDGNLADAAALDAHEHLQVGGHVTLVLHDVQRGGRGDQVKPAGLVGDRCRGTAGPFSQDRPASHGSRERQHQDHAGGQGGVHEILADTAKKLLDDDDGDERTDDRDPERDCRRKIHGQEEAGDQSAHIADGIIAFHDPAAQVFKKDSGARGQSGDQEHAPAKDPGRGQDGRDQRNHDIEHQAPGGD